MVRADDTYILQKYMSSIFDQISGRNYPYRHQTVACNEYLPDTSYPLVDVRSPNGRIYVNQIEVHFATNNIQAIDGVIYVSAQVNTQKIDLLVLPIQYNSLTPTDIRKYSIPRILTDANTPVWFSYEVIGPTGRVFSTASGDRVYATVAYCEVESE